MQKTFLIRTDINIYQSKKNLLCLKTYPFRLSEAHRDNISSLESILSVDCIVCLENYRENVRMKDSRENLIKRFLCAQTNTKLFKQENKLYSFFLHEDFYPIIVQNANSTFDKSSSVLKRSNIPFGASGKKYQRRSFLTIKYIIFLFRSNKFSDIKRSCFFHTRSSGQKKDDYYLYLQSKKKIIFYLILESIAFILLCSQQKKSLSEKFFLRTKHISISIHKPLAFLEKEWQYSSFGFQGYFCRFFHPEVLVRILRKKIQDISFLHLIRKFLHSILYLSDNTFKESPSNKIRNILWNIYVLEIDNFFVTNCKNYSTFDKWNYVSSNQSLSCIQKRKEWTYFLQKEEYLHFSESTLIPYEVSHLFTAQNSEYQLHKKRQISFLAQSSTYKYLRTNTNWFLFFQKEKPWNGLINRRILQFFNRRLGYVFQKKTRSSLLSSSRYHKGSPFGATSSYFFLAYILQFTKEKFFVKINTKNFVFLSYFIKRVVSFINPFYLIILILSKQNFCNSFGYPKSKSGWVTWTDSDIIQHFNRIRNSLFLFYSGCNNNKSLSRIQYILHFSCAKTLACKHKTNLRQISKKFANTDGFILKGLTKPNQNWGVLPCGEPMATAPQFFAGGPEGRATKERCFAASEREKNNLKNKDFPKRSSSTFFVPNQSKNYRLRSLYSNQKMTRVWNFHLTQMDSIILHLEDFSKLVKR